MCPFLLPSVAAVRVLPSGGCGRISGPLAEQVHGDLEPSCMSLRVRRVESEEARGLYHHLDAPQSAENILTTARSEGHALRPAGRWLSTCGSPRSSPHEAPFGQMLSAVQLHGTHRGSGSIRLQECTAQVTATEFKPPSAFLNPKSGPLYMTTVSSDILLNLHYYFPVKNL